MTTAKNRAQNARITNLNRTNSVLRPAMWVIPLVVLIVFLAGGLLWMAVSAWLPTLAENASRGQTLQTSAPDSDGDQSDSDLAVAGGVYQPELYTHVDKGDSMQQVATIVGAPNECMEVPLELLGLQKVCTWHNAASSMTVTFLDDKVVAKHKIGF